jgi:hypothetical protein
MTTVNDLDSGTAAAACGGVVTICDYAWPRPGQSVADAIATWQAKAAYRAHIDCAFHLVISEATAERLSQVPEIGRAGYPSFKVFMISEFTIGDDDSAPPRGGGREGAVVNVHAENGAMLDHVASALLRAGHRDPGHFAASRPAIAATATREPWTMRPWWVPRYKSSTSRAGGPGSRAGGPRVQASVGGDAANLPRSNRGALRTRRVGSGEDGRDPSASFAG